MDDNGSLFLWTAFAVASAILGAIAIALARPARHRDWKASTAFLGFVAALVAEIVLVPLGVFLAWSWLLQELAARRLSHDAADLLRLVLGWRMHRHAAWLEPIGAVLIACGLAVLVLAWKSLLDAKRSQRLATTGVHGIVRHPQYVGFVLIMLGFLLQWPTLPTLAMFPILLTMYVRLARREEREALEQFGMAYARYAADTPGFVPQLRKPAPSTV
jgi:protein-S-isoprenylcysteine O-methyltransferase Ste14